MMCKMLFAEPDDQNRTWFPMWEMRYDVSLVFSNVEAGNQGYIRITYLQKNVLSCST